MGIAHIFDPPKYWLGFLLVGLLILVLIGVGAAIGLSKLNANSATQRWKNMSRENAGSAASSGATSNKPPPLPKKKTDLSEADYLAAQQSRPRPPWTGRSAT